MQCTCEALVHNRMILRTKNNNISSKLKIYMVPKISKINLPPCHNLLILADIGKFRKLRNKLSADGCTIIKCVCTMIGL